MEKDLAQKGQFLRCLTWLGGGLTPNETLSNSNGKFNLGPKKVILGFFNKNTPLLKNGLFSEKNTLFFLFWGGGPAPKMEFFTLFFYFEPFPINGPRL